MSVAKITEISAESTVSFEDAIKTGIARASRTLSNITGAWVESQQVQVRDGKAHSFRVHMKVTFILND